MEVHWHKSTRDDLAAIRSFYEPIDPALAQNILAQIFSTARQVGSFPQLGREGRVEGTRELPVPKTKFIIAYMFKGDRPIVLMVYHTSREWPVVWLMSLMQGRAAGAERDGRFVPQHEVERQNRAHLDGEAPDPPQP